MKAVLLYGAETWKLTKGVKEKLEVFINKSLRYILQIWWPRRIRNIRGALEANRAATSRGRDKTKSLGLDWPHAEETRRSSVAKSAPEWNPQGKCKRGRPQHNWRCTRMAELEERHLTWQEIKATAQNRVRSWELVEDLCYTRNKED